jgi:hypothetical protein
VGMAHSPSTPYDSLGIPRRRGALHSQASVSSIDTDGSASTRG